MTAEPKYIITEEQLLDTKSYIYHEDEESFIKIERDIRSNPYNPQAEREKVLDELVSWVNLGNLELEKYFPCDRLMIKLRELRQGKVEK